jgi:hypothetical protein
MPLEITHPHEVLTRDGVLSPEIHDQLIGLVSLGAHEVQQELKRQIHEAEWELRSVQASITTILWNRAVPAEERIKQNTQNEQRYRFLNEKIESLRNLSRLAQIQQAYEEIWGKEDAEMLEAQSAAREIMIGFHENPGDFAKLIPHDGRRIYTLPDHPDWILREKGLDILPAKLLPLRENSQVVRVLYSFMVWGRGFDIMERAIGKECSKLTPEEWKDIPEEHYRVFIQTWKELEKIGVVIDPSKSNNFFYDSKIGFQFIDLWYDYFHDKRSQYHPNTVLVALINLSLRSPLRMNPNHPNKDEYETAENHVREIIDRIFHEE